MIKENIEILALKIGEKYGIIEDKTLVFTPEFNIKLTLEEKEIKALVEFNSTYINDFFGNEVSNICGIVGKNGVGKTTILRYIKDLFLKEGSDIKIRHNDVIIYKENNLLVLYCNDKFRDKVKFDIPSTYKPVIKYYKDYPKLNSIVKNLNVVYYSNNLDPEVREVESSNYFNISTSFLLENLGRINSRLRNKRIRYQNPHSRFSYTEMQRQINFINNLKSAESSLNIPFKRIENLQVIINEVIPSDYNKLRKKLNIFKDDLLSDENFKEKGRLSDLLNDIESCVKNFENKFYRERRELNNNKSDAFILNLIENITIIILDYVAIDDILIKAFIEEKELYSYLFDRIFKFSNEEEEVSKVSLTKLISDIKTFLNEKQGFEGKFNEYLSKYDFSRRIKKLVKELESMQSFIDFTFQIINQFESNGNTITISTLNPELKGILNDYYGSDFNYKFISFKWPRLSAGEESLIAFYSRLHAIAEDSKAQNLILLIDEGELYFHPEWQRKYIYFLLEFYKSNLVDYKNIQMIITTHSPFIVSDLPSEYVLFLNKENENSPVDIMNSKDLDLETFGGNIHALYSKAFFIGERTTSEFAHNKIMKDVFYKIQNKDNDRIAITKVLDKIGEPILKSILTNRLEESEI